MPAQPHVPVLLAEVLDTLWPPGTAGLRRFIDGTVGAGGHSEALLEKGVEELLGLDRDAAALALSQERLARFSPRFQLQQRNFADIEAAAAQIGWDAVDGVLLDLGLSSMQLACAERGFSFQKNGPLDMRFDRSEGEPASCWLNEAAEKDLAAAFFHLGEVKQSRRIASALVASRPLATTRQLSAVVERTLRQRKKRSSIHPATRVFQAIRMLINDELGALDSVLPAAIRMLRPGGRLAIISFHSLEDRRVKRFFRDASRDCLCPPETIYCECDHVASVRLITRRAIQPSAEEIASNRRCRSARLRVVEAIG